MIFFNKVLVTNKKKVFVFLDELKGKSLLEKKESRGELMMLYYFFFFFFFLIISDSSTKLKQEKIREG